MAERKLTIPIGPNQVAVTEVQIVGRKDGLIEYTLEDGSVIRIAVAPNQILRMDNTWDGDDNPLCLVKHGTVITTISAPEHLRRK